MKPTQFRKMVNQMTIKYAVADNFSIDLEEENPDQKILEEERMGERMEERNKTKQIQLNSYLLLY